MCEKILNVKEAPKCETNYLHPLRTLLEVFVHAKNCLPLLFFVRAKYFRWKNKPLWNCPKNLIYCDSRDALPRHLSHYFLVSPYYLQGAMRCQWSSSDLQDLRELFLPSGLFLPYAPSCWFKVFPGRRQFNLNVSRASCWSSKQSPGPTIRSNHNNPQKK